MYVATKGDNGNNNTTMQQVSMVPADKDTVTYLIQLKYRQVRFTLMTKTSHHVAQPNEARGKAGRRQTVPLKDRSGHDASSSLAFRSACSISNDRFWEGPSY
ncbi:hypothetical protein PoB_007191200 [Plakobranchus ocellatus]|uniref:Uncharacterized protein n=1 Tax=Plakobranchus ocellatus TaxID=259542 RepID=A0AAV4DM77_9GAST|nr:hypothetical protein PoB_007191200 [Plakobranchus ocellatus]